MAQLMIRRGASGAGVRHVFTKGSEALRQRGNRKYGTHVKGEDEKRIPAR
jgi:hypothetical protein